MFKSSNEKFWFTCENEHAFKSTLNNINNNNTWCPFCVNKTETKLYEWLKKFYPEVKVQVKYNWCKNNRCLPFDFCIEDLKLIIELDGDQHFKQVSNWTSVEKIQITDRKK